MIKNDIHTLEYRSFQGFHWSLPRQVHFPQSKHHTEELHNELKHNNSNNSVNFTEPAFKFCRGIGKSVGRKKTLLYNIFFNVFNYRYQT